MKKVKKLLRLVGLTILIGLALMGIGIGGAGPVFSSQKERYPDNGIRTELVESKEEDEVDSELKDVKN
ncbi:hypothetical protein [Larkinella rosea]|uniref:Uncharacterized protein n=1 Tax=Larkinella rosea TaxID=2025312 RepID=A0A3P1BI18_9BACT|nr:hypothetical protein [Larkinella rosea]RRB00720.1 hypothetical protein EHT25_21220 [Larkinella rosea]